ncbi:MAG TPA: prephenate dehydrogenase dimerization domain-containing protein, partial [Clostridia bacterium]|nr:prephenate dehydrogenase dimerization domain-containing protein [Clostridia bacterium]
QMIAYTSQLAHIVSSSFVKNPRAGEHAGFSSGSFRDMTRVAKLNPDMWTELFLDNRDNLISQIEILEEHISEYKTALKENNAEKLNNLLAEGVKMKELAENNRKERRKND